MSHIPDIVFMVLGPLAVGGAFLLSLPVLETAGLSFYRTNGLVFLGVGLIGVAISKPPASGLATEAFWLTPPILPFLFFLLILGIYNLRLWFRHPHPSRSLLYAASVAGGVALWAMTDAFPETGMAGTDIARMILQWTSLILSALLMGAGVLAMLLGHRYLTQPSLSMVPLDRLTRLFMQMLCTQAGMAGANLIALAHTARLRQALLLDNIEGVYLWARMLVGLVTPLVLAWMIRQTVAERATMSATGLLYIAMLMVLIGEIFSRFFLLTGAAFL